MGERYSVFCYSCLENDTRSSKEPCRTCIISRPSNFKQAPMKPLVGETNEVD